METHGKQKSHSLFRLSTVGLACYVSILPTLALVACVGISLWKDYEKSTATHCFVPNFLPSISSAIGSYTPQCYIWRICIALHCAPRLMLALSYHGYFTNIAVPRKERLFRAMATVTTLLHVVETLAVIGLSYISSSEAYELHKGCFVLFLVCSQVYMVLSIWLFSWSREHRNVTSKDEESYKLKVRLCLLNIGSAILAGYLYYVHHQYCEPGIYSWAALMEYTVVLTNIAYHSTMVLDFAGGEVVFCKEVQHPKSM